MRKIIFFAFFITISFQLFSQKNSKQEYYLIKIYHCTDVRQIKNIEEYVGKELIPFLHRSQVERVGVFMPIDNDTLQDKKLYVWMPLAQLDILENIEKRFTAISPFSNNALVHLDSNYNKAPYDRIETMLTVAFSYMPHYVLNTTITKSVDNIYEWRSYESATENLHLRKVDMFNDGGEISLFKKLHFNAAFYSRVIIGARMPNLIYMTRFQNKADRDAHWSIFGNDAEWKRISALPQYANAINKLDITLLKASAYSEL